MKIKLRDATGQQIHEAFKAGCAENIRHGVCVPKNCTVAGICCENPDNWDLDTEIEVKGKGKRTQANILLKRVYDLSKSVPSIPCTQPIFEDIEDYLVSAGIAELNEVTEGCDTCNQETIRTALIISGHKYCDQCGKKLRNTRTETEEVDDWDVEEFLNSKDIYDHPMISDRLNNNGYEVASLIAEFYNKRISKTKGRKR